MIARMAAAEQGQTAIVFCEPDGVSNRRTDIVLFKRGIVANDFLRR